MSVQEMCHELPMCTASLPSAMLRHCSSEKWYIKQNISMYVTYINVFLLYYIIKFTKIIMPTELGLQQLGFFPDRPSYPETITLANN